MKVVKYSEMPFLLKQIPKCPYSLYALGNVDLLSKRCLSIVGTRKMSSYGMWCIEYFLDRFLKDLDICVVSGLAMGVDAHVHRVCLERGISTIAIVPGGMYSAIPLCNVSLFNRIKEEGLILAEFSSDVVFRRDMFVLRNRLLAGMSESTIVVEAGIGSGSLITANFALDFNRDIYAIPGCVGENMSRGCNMLLKQGAGILTCLDDLKEMFGVHDEQLMCCV